MRPLQLRITNFRSFKGTQVFTFPDADGLYFMQGVNALEPRLEANGSGKSSIWDALSWVFFEKTPSGLKAGDVCNWDVEKGTRVEFDYAPEGVPGAVCTVARSWKPNTWTLGIGDGDGPWETEDLTKATSNQVLADLRLEFNSFLNSVLTAQRQPMFLDLAQTAQAALFSDVLGLDRWLEYSAKASKKASEQDTTTRRLERELAQVEGELAAVSKQDFREDMRVWEERRADRVRIANEDYDALLEKGKRLKVELAFAVDGESTARKALQKAQPDADLNIQFREHTRLLNRLNGDLREEETKVDALLDHIQKLEEDAICPTCGQDLNKVHRERELDKAEAAHKERSAKCMALREERRKVEEAVERMGRRVEQDGDALTKARDDLDDATRAHNAIRRNFDMNERELDRLEEQVQEMEKERNPYEDMEERAREQGRKLRKQCDEVREDLDRSMEKYSLYSFWVRGFKELRLTQIAEALVELEIETNSALMQLGLVDWELKFQVDRETKGGGIQKGFNAAVRSPHNTRAVPWEAWSGGEAQRLRIAATWGLANLIRSRTGATLPLEVWDEPMLGLSPQGQRDLLEALATRARVEQRQIWLVDHGAHDFGGFAGGAVITKTESGSSIEQH